MCWICSTDKFKLQRAEEDIVVYKVLKLDNDKLYSPKFNCFIWIEGETYGSPIDIHTCKREEYYYLEGLQGIHSYQQKPIYDVYYESFVSRTFYSPTCSMPASYPQLEGMCIAKCIIPKGAIYAINDYEEVISEKLKLIKVVE